MSKSGRRQSASPFAAEVRDTILKSGLTGVAAAAVAVTVCSSTGVGGFIGVGMASDSDGGFAPNTVRARDGGPVFSEVRAPLTATELTDIRSRLSESASALDQARAATDETIEYLREIADVGVSSDSHFAESSRASDVELARLLLSSSNNG